MHTKVTSTNVTSTADSSLLEAIQAAPLSTIPADAFLQLMNHPKVGRHLPLLTSPFTLDDHQTFLRDKQRLWDEHHYGPVAFLIDGKFAGWGGLQAEQGEADIALILHPQFWGYGLRIFKHIHQQAFEQLGLDSITALLPVGRPNNRAITRLGFKKTDTITLHGQAFQRFKLTQTQ